MLARIWIIILVMSLMPFSAAGQSDERAVDLDSLQYVILHNQDTDSLYYYIQQKVMVDQDFELQYNRSIQVLDYIKEHGDSLQLMSAYHVAGYCANQVGEYHEALDYSFKALDIANRKHRENTIATLLLNIASYYYEVNTDECLKYYDIALNANLKINHSANIEFIYYNLGIFYMEHEIHHIAMEYFKKAQAVYLTTPYVNPSSTLEYEHAISFNRVMSYIEHGDTLSALNLLDTLNTDKESAGILNEFGSIANYAISGAELNLLASTVCPLGKRDSYLELSKYFLDLLSNCIDRFNVQWLLTDSYNPLYAKYLLYTNQLSKLRQLLQDPGNFDDGSAYYEISYLYYKQIGDYEKAYEYMEITDRIRYKSLSLQHAVRYEDMQAKRDYEKQLNEFEEEAMKRNLELELERDNHETVLKFFSVALIIVVVIVALFLNSTYYINRQIEVLKLTNKQIISKNIELNKLQQEILLQTDEIKKQSLIIQQQRDSLEETNHLLTYSISIGSFIQRALIWDSSTIREIIGDCFVIWKPLYLVSGDFYWVSSIGDRKFIIAADCTGHGVPGALLSMYGISMLNDYVKRNSSLTAAEILEIFKSAFLESFVRGDNNFFEGIDCALVILNRATGKVNYAGAKRPLLKIHNGEITEYQPDRICIGLNPFRKNATFTNHFLDVEKGDMLYIYSDGIADQFGDEDCKTKFGNRQLKDILSEMSFFDTSIQKSIVESVVDNWCNGTYLAGLSREKVPQLDDQLLIGVRV